MSVTLRKQILLKGLLVLLLAFIVSDLCIAQEKQKVKRKRYDWGNMGLGYSDQNFYSDITGTNYGVDYNILLGKIFLQGGITGYLSVSSSSSTMNGIYAGAGYGIGYYNKFLLALSICPSYLSGVYLYTDDSTQLLYSKDYRQLGITTNLQIIGKPAGDFGFGLELFGTFSKYVSTTGVRFVFHISTKPPDVIRRD